jgi:lipopolysaccharide export system permease protein
MKKTIYIKFYVDVLKMFFLTSFTLVAVLWILQAVNFLDIVSEDGHSLYTYFGYSFLNIPKIFSKTFLLSFFIALFYVLTTYEENNQLLIYWSNNISKKKFLNLILSISFALMLLSIFLSFWVVPLSQDNARIKIRSSNLDFFPSLIKPKQFIDTVENLTVFIDKKNNNLIENIFLKDSSNNKSVQTIISKKGKIINLANEKVLLLENGKIINTNIKGKITTFNFEETNLDLTKYNTKTTTFSKIKELKSMDIIDCLKILRKIDFTEFENFVCQKRIEKNLLQEIYKRVYKPLYILVISVVVSFLILKPHVQSDYGKWKLIIFFIGIFIVVLSEISISLISLNLIKSSLNILFVPITFVISYYLFSTKSKKL